MVWCSVGTTSEGGWGRRVVLCWHDERRWLGNLEVPACSYHHSICEPTSIRITLMIATNSVASGETNMSWCASHAGRDEHRSRSMDAGSESMAFVMVAELREDCERDARAGGWSRVMASRFQCAQQPAGLSATWVIGPLQAIGKTVLMAAAARRYSLSVNVPNVSGCVFILTAAG